MIVEVKEEQLKEIANFSWKYYYNKNQCSFPKFKSYKEMYEIFLKSINNRERRLLACYEDGKILGSLNFILLEYDEFIQFIGGIFADGNYNYVAEKFVKYLRDNYCGYEIYMGYPKENEQAIKFAELNGAILVESSFTMKLKEEDFKVVVQCDEVIPLQSEYYNEYKIFHDKHNKGIYWNSKRLFEKIDLWQIYIIRDNEKIIAEIFLKVVGNLAEVFGLSIEEDYRSNGYEVKLLSKAVKDILEQGKDEILYFVEEEATDEFEATLKLGFKQIDNYRCYKLP